VKKMTAIGARSFRKTAACPSETILISYRTKKLAPEIMNLVRAHLGSCDFCSAELGLLGYYSQPQRGECKPPDIPMNLRVLAESLLYQSGKVQINDVPRTRNDRRKPAKTRK
jgi:hypothetical protein